MFGELSPLTGYEVVFVARRKSTLHTLTELQPTETFRGARLELPRLYASLYVLEFAREATVEGVAQPRVYALVHRALHRIARNLTYNPLTLVIFELLVLDALGFGVRLDSCAECGAELGGGDVILAPSLGGICCRACASRDRSSRAMTGAAWEALRLLPQDPEYAARVRADEELLTALRGHLNALVTARFERPLRLAPYVSACGGGDPGRAS
jgi:DNA repair protein RecO